VLFLTGLADTEHVLKGLEAGGVDYVTKPVIIEELIARIRIHMSNARVAFGARVALDVTGRHLVAVDRNGRLRWCTPQAAALLATNRNQPIGDKRALSPIVSEQLASAIAAGFLPGRDLTLDEPNGGMTAAFLCENGRDEFLFRLVPDTGGREQEALCRSFGLTSREAEVLSWIARGKSNHDISDFLGISPRTVDKHSERVFTKLGVENRSAATAVALKALAARL
jgi:DNA-binding NarL/FixJ family response regulator